MSYSLAQSTRDVWRAVRDAAPEGLTPGQVQAVINGRRKPGGTKTMLQTLRRRKHLRFEGQTTGGRWHVGTVVLPGECAEQGAATLQAAHTLGRRAPAQIDPAAIASIWALAARA